MSWAASADPVDFDEAIAWHRDRVHLTKAQWDKLVAYAKKKAFTVAGVAQLDMVSEVWRAIDRALDQGTTLTDFKKAIGEHLQNAWQGTVAAPGSRVETIFRTNVQLAYSAGRYEQAVEVKDERPYWMFDALLDSRASEICEECDGTVRPADDPWWRTHQPPLHHNCRSSLTTLTPERAGERGVSKRGPAVPARDGFGQPPSQDDWEPDASAYPRELWSAFKSKR